MTYDRRAMIAAPLLALALLAWAFVAAPPGLAEWQARRAALETTPGHVTAPFAPPAVAAPLPGMRVAAFAGDAFGPVRAATCLLHALAVVPLTLLAPHAALLFALSPGIARESVLTGAGLGWGFLFVILLILKYLTSNIFRGLCPPDPPPKAVGLWKPVDVPKRDRGSGAVGPGGVQGWNPCIRVVLRVIQVSEFLFIHVIPLAVAALFLLPATPDGGGDAFAAAVARIFPDPGVLAYLALLALLGPVLLETLGIRGAPPHTPPEPPRARSIFPSSLLLPLLLAALFAAPWGGAPPLLALAMLLAGGETLRRLTPRAGAAVLLVFLFTAALSAHVSFGRTDDPRDGEFAPAARLAASSAARLLLAKDWSAPLLSELTGLPGIPFPTLADTGETELSRLDAPLDAASTARAIAFMHHADDDGHGSLTSDALLARLGKIFEMRIIGESGLLRVYEGKRRE